MGILLRSAALALGAVAATVLFALPASAHADLVRSDPADGSVLAHAPSVAQLWFSETISPKFSSARVVDHTGATITGSHFQEGGDPAQLTVELPSLGTGTYGLVWQVLAEDDGHTTRGVVVVLGEHSPHETVGPRPKPRQFHGELRLIAAAHLGTGTGDGLSCVVHDAGRTELR